jgi:hypothetical protein
MMRKKFPIPGPWTLIVLIAIGLFLITVRWLWALFF